MHLHTIDFHTHTSDHIYILLPEFITVELPEILNPLLPLLLAFL